MIEAQSKTGFEPFRYKGEELDIEVLSFWRWAHSDLLGNALRGILAEFIVAKAIGAETEMREEWDAFDLVSPSGAKVEVKSAAYLQSWEQKQLSKIQFTIKPTRAWEGAHGRGEARRQADKYVFCLLDHKHRETVDPTNLDQWLFYVLDTKTLDEELGPQKSLSLSGLQAICERGLNFAELNNAIP